MSELAERIDHFLTERAALDEHQRELNERLQRGEWVQISTSPVVPTLDDGFALLREAADALRYPALIPQVTPETSRSEPNAADTDENESPAPDGDSRC